MLNANPKHELKKQQYDELNKETLEPNWKRASK